MNIRAGLVFLLTSVFFITDLYACDVDSDCGPGGTCIKREKRASGVCYGGGASKKTETPRTNTSSESVEKAVKSSEIPCIVTQDCPEGMECVIAGFDSACVKLD
jgi:hypothetical protein